MTLLGEGVFRAGGEVGRRSWQEEGTLGCGLDGFSPSSSPMVLCLMPPFPEPFRLCLGAS